MNSRVFCFTLLSTIAISIAASVPAQAQRARVFVSVNGFDSGDCRATVPCRTFQFAHDAVLPGGEISVLDTGGFSPLTINKAISIVATGVEASIAIASGDTGIVIAAGSTDKVSLRGLTLDGTAVGTVGISFQSGQSLTVADCVVRNMTGDGLDYFSVVSTLQMLAVSNSYFNDNANSGIHIITVSSGAITAAVDHTVFSGNGNNGLEVDGRSGTGALTVAVTDSVAANNFDGFLVESATSHSFTNLSLTHALAEGNSIGVEATGANTTLWLAQSTLTGNASHGFVATSGGTINSYGDNYSAAANGANTGSLTAATKQ